MLPNPNPNQPAQTTVIGGQQPLKSTIPNYPFAPYQVKAGDTFANIANTYGVDETALQGANNNMLVHPPTGSYINVPIKQPPLGITQGIPEAVLYPYNRQATPPVSPSNALNAYRQGEKGTYNPYGTTDPYGAGGGGVTNAQQGEINQIIASGKLPANIPFGTQILNPATGQPATFRDMQANGYVFSPATNSWTLKGGQGVPVGSGGTNVNSNGTYAQNIASNIQAIQTGKNDGTFQRVKASENYGAFVAQEKAFLSAKRWDPERKKYVSVGKLIQEGKLNNKTGSFNPWKKSGGGGGGGSNTPEPVLGAGTNPQQQLNTNQGGG